MPATKQDLVIEQNATGVFVVTVNGGPDTLLGLQGEMQIREAKAATDVLAELGPEDIEVDPDNRQVIVTIPSAESAGYDWEEGVYDLYLVGASERWRLAEGRVRLSRSVTREA